MERIASFTINHLNLMPGLYVSRRDAKGDCVTTTFDLRITAPNREPVIDTPALHTIEHLAATYLRNSESKEDVIVKLAILSILIPQFLLFFFSAFFYVKLRKSERKFIDLLQFFFRELRIFNRFDIVKQLLRFRCSHQYTGYDSIS